MQSFDRRGCGYTYLLADANTREGVIIDPKVDLLDRDLELAHQLAIRLKYARE